MTEQLITREVCNPKRFQNRRQVSSYLGLCPGEHSSGQRQQRGRITKTGKLSFFLPYYLPQTMRYESDKLTLVFATDTSN